MYDVYTMYIYIYAYIYTHLCMMCILCIYIYMHIYMILAVVVIAVLSSAVPSPSPGPWQDAVWPPLLYPVHSRVAPWGQQLPCHLEPGMAPGLISPWFQLENWQDTSRLNGKKTWCWCRFSRVDQSNDGLFEVQASFLIGWNAQISVNDSGLTYIPLIGDFPNTWSRISCCSPELWCCEPIIITAHCSGELCSVREDVNNSQLRCADMSLQQITRSLNPGVSWLDWI